MIRLGVVMDPIGALHYEKDSTLAMLWEAQARGWELTYFEQGDLYLQGPEPRGRSRRLTVYKDKARWYALEEEADIPLSALDVLLMRKDPPFDLEYLYTTHVLELAEALGVLVVNRPRSLRDANEKLFALRFPQCIPPTLVTREPARLRAFAAEHGDIVVKPLDVMGGASVFRVRRDDPNGNVIFATMTGNGARTIMAQRFVPEIAEGDKRILLIDGEPVPYALARIPAPGEFRGNLAAGGTGVGAPLSERDRWICGQVAPALKERGLLFVGLDVIGDYLTEINVTSPTCIRELDKLYGLNIAAGLLDAVSARVTHSRSRSGSLK
ncbi:glutathione synthetase [Sulfurifustis variabilis]|uniref:Glutathione synthetase n=1 Tax=Sulfurifustis variabilis TaxID=1675686 RepID=A0A1B4VBS6_9GAMM|nr:glutathione synthase [Sulfurifustis variabilis]BAU50034.1 glutathione synthetase [Sulfurifustis variabilis]